MGHQIAKILYGSQNYGLSTPTSDHDYHIIEFPSIPDILKFHSLNRKLNEHESVWDVRNFFKYIMDAKFGAIELLFSCEYESKQDKDFDNLYHTLMLHSDSIIRVNWSTFTRSLKGMAFSGVRKELSPKMLNRFFYLYELWRATYNADGKLDKTCFAVHPENPIPERVSSVGFEWDAEKYPVEPHEEDPKVIDFLNKEIENYFTKHLKGE